MDMNFWPELAFAIVVFFFTVYSVLDGFDLGIGCLVPFTRNREEADRLVSHIAPFWDGNEVWLVMGAAFLFAAFPVAYAMLLSTFYLPFMVTIAAFMLRAASLEFSYHDEPRLKLWRGLFGAGSALAAFFGLAALGALLAGLPFTGPGLVSSRPADVVSPFALWFGLAGVTVLLWHGIAYALSRHASDFLLRLGRRVWFMAAGASVITMGLWLLQLPQSPARLVVWLGGALYAVGLVLSRLCLGAGPRAFRASALAIVGFWLAAGAELFPNLLVARGRPEWTLSLVQAAAPVSSVRPLAVITLILIPVIAGYSFFVYKTIHGDRQTGAAGEGG